MSKEASKACCSIIRLVANLVSDCCHNLQLPALDSVCMSVFLEGLSKVAAESLNVVVLDNAPAHIARGLVVAENIVLLALPPYSPELNPVERLWLAIRKKLNVFDQKIRSSLRALEEHVGEIYSKQNGLRKT